MSLILQHQNENKKIPQNKKNQQDHKPNQENHNPGSFLRFPWIIWFSRYQIEHKFDTFTIEEIKLKLELLFNKINWSFDNNLWIFEYIVWAR